MKQLVDRAGRFLIGNRVVLLFVAFIAPAIFLLCLSWIRVLFDVDLVNGGFASQALATLFLLTILFFFFSRYVAHRLGRPTVKGGGFRDDDEKFFQEAFAAEIAEHGRVRFALALYALLAVISVVIYGSALALLALYFFTFQYS